MVKLFVYGTLRTPTSGEPADTGNHQSITEELLSHEPAVLEGAQLISFVHYPGIIPGEGTVIGELFELTDAGLEICDLIESHPNFYRRTKVEVRTMAGHDETAFVYWAPDNLVDSGIPVPSGDWFDRDRSDHDGRTLDAALAEDIEKY